MLLALHTSANSLHEDSVATDTLYHFVKWGSLRNKSRSAPPILEMIPLAMRSDGFCSATIDGDGFQYISTTQKCLTNYEILFHHHHGQNQTFVVALQILH